MQSVESWREREGWISCCLIYVSLVSKDDWRSFRAKVTFSCWGDPQWSGRKVFAVSISCASVRAVNGLVVLRLGTGDAIA